MEKFVPPVTSHPLFQSLGIGYRLGLYDAGPDGQRFLVNGDTQTVSNVPMIKRPDEDQRILDAPRMGDPLAGRHALAPHSPVAKDSRTPRSPRSSFFGA